MPTQVIITLAHLLHPHTPSYESSKESLLDTTAALAMQTTSSAATTSSNNGNNNSEVHLVLTGSPRPTFAETNAWLLDGSTPRKRSSTVDSNHSSCSSININSGVNNNSNEEEEGSSSLIHSYIQDSQFSGRHGNVNDVLGSPTKTGGSVLSHYRQQKSSTESNSKNDDINDVGETTKNDNNTNGPLVGQAVVNAVQQTDGIGLHSSRAKLLQGTIDRPLWDQNRWTDGECLFSDLIDRCGLESFANTLSSSAEKYDSDDAVGIVREKKILNLSAHLITVPLQLPLLTGSSSSSQSGLPEETVNEIARSVLRLLKRKKSSAVETVYLVMTEEEYEKHGVVISQQFKQAWRILERYNDMIGEIKLMDGLMFEFVNA